MIDFEGMCVFAGGEGFYQGMGLKPTAAQCLLGGSTSQIYV